MKVGTAIAAAMVYAVSAQRPPAIEIPFDFRVKQPIVSVSVNGQTPLPFVVDTGASIHVINTGVAEKANGAQFGASRQMSGGGLGTVQSQSVAGLTFAVGATTWTNQRASAVNLGYPATKHYAGLIGAPILTKYVVQFDFAKTTMRLLDPASYEPPSGSVQVPFELEEDLPIVHVSIDAGGGPLDARLMVDTGASQFAVLNRPFVDAHNLVELNANATAVNQPAGIGTPAPVLNVTARRITFGGKTFEGPRLGLSRATSGSGSRSERDGIIGNDLLRNFLVTIDYQRRLLVLQ